MDPFHINGRMRWSIKQTIEDSSHSGGYLFSLDGLWQSSDSEIMAPTSVVEVFHMALHISHL